MPFYFNGHEIHDWDSYPYLPTISSSASVDLGLILFQMSMVKTVAELLNTDVSDDIRAAIMAASITPFIPKLMISENYEAICRYSYGVMVRVDQGRFCFMLMFCFWLRWWWTMYVVSYWRKPSTTAITHTHTHTVNMTQKMYYNLHCST